MLYTPLPLLVPSNLCERHAAILLMIDVGKGNLGHKSVRLPRFGHNAVQLVDLLERETLGLVNHKVYESNTYEAKGSPYEKDLGLEVGMLGVDHVWSGVSNRPV